MTRCVGPRDALHAGVQELARVHHGPVVTTEYVLVETANFLSRVPDRAADHHFEQAGFHAALRLNIT